MSCFVAYVVVVWLKRTIHALCKVALHHPTDPCHTATILALFMHDGKIQVLMSGTSEIRFRHHFISVSYCADHGLLVYRRYKSYIFLARPWLHVGRFTPWVALECATVLAQYLERQPIPARCFYLPRNLSSSQAQTFAP
jgi:hypothetical protein